PGAAVEIGNETNWAPAGTVTVDGTPPTAGLLLAKEITIGCPEGEGPVRVTFPVEGRPPRTTGGETKNVASSPGCGAKNTTSSRSSNPPGVHSPTEPLNRQLKRRARSEVPASGNVKLTVRVCLPFPEAVAVATGVQTGLLASAAAKMSRKSLVASNAHTST